MFENSYQPRHHRGSSPPVREPESEMNHDKNLQAVNNKNEYGHGPDKKPDTNSDQNVDALWQDEGGEGG